MKSSGDWSNYLSIVFVRALGGGFVGALAGILFGGVGRRRGGFILRNLANDELQPIVIC